MRDRKTGPRIPVTVLKCRTHRRAFTLYPLGHIPYGRLAVAPVGLDGDQDPYQVRWLVDQDPYQVRWLTKTLTYQDPYQVRWLVKTLARLDQDPYQVRWLVDQDPYQVRWLTKTLTRFVC